LRVDGKSFKGPLAEYLDRFGGQDKKMTEKKKKIQERGPLTFVERMTELYELLDYVRVSILVSRDHLEEELVLLKTCRSPSLLWALGQEYAAKIDDKEERNKSRHELFLAVLGELANRLRDVPEVGYSMRYEHARGLHRFGRNDEAKAAFYELYADSFEARRIPVINSAIRDALGREEWRRLMRNAAEVRLKREDARSVLVLAEQAQRLGDEGLSDELIDRAIASDEEGTRLVREAIALLCRENRLDRAEAITAKLVAKKERTEDPEAWRLAARVALLRHGQTAKTIALLERALDLEWRQRARSVQPADVRRDYDTLLSHYQRLVQASVDLEQSPPPELFEKVPRAVERWRVLDPHGDALKRGIDVLIALGDHESAWDYLTTLMAKEEVSAYAWKERADRLREAREYELAKRCLKEAEAMEPDSASLLMEQAKLLREMGRRDEGRALLKRLVHEKWSAQYDEVGEEARRMLGER
jgi:predicted Zn-dependent protease